MPELPEVEAVCQVVRRALRGRRIVSACVWRPRICAPQTPAEFARVVSGRKFRSVERLGKNIVIHLDSMAVLCHLRMTGNLYAVRSPDQRPSTASAHFVLDNDRTLVFDDQRGLGVMRAVPADQLPSAMGPIGLDPLSPDFTSERLIELARASRTSIKLLLMNQRRIAGLGNIYAAEALFRAGIDPRRRSASLSNARLARLHAAIVAVLFEATKSASRAYLRPGGFSEGESFKAAVYRREGQPCRRCQTPIRRVVQAGRSSYFCPRCQR